MELTILAGLAIPAFILVLLLVSLYQSFKEINFGFKKNKQPIASESKEKNVIRNNNPNSGFNHLDLSGGLLGI